MDNELKKPSPFKRAMQWVKTHKLKTALWVLGSLIAIGLIIAAIIVFAMPQVIQQGKILTIEKPAPPPEYFSPLTGNKVESDAITKQAVTGIMIENSPDARPQSGIKQAGVVYEAIAEGGITRFLCLYQEAKPQLIGPVRSLRMYYVDWVAPYNASVAHIGGSAAALAEVRNGNYRDIDQFFNAGSYWRARDRYAPHNVYTSFEKLDALNQSKGYTTSQFTGFPRVDGKTSETPTASSISINFSGPAFNTNYTYNAATNAYQRSVGGEAHKDREEGAITPAVVIAMKVNMHRVFEDGYREEIQANSSGQATIFQNGTAQEVTWQKPSRGAQISFTDASGSPVSLVRGQTWIAAIPNGSGSVSWQ